MLGAGPPTSACLLAELGVWAQSLWGLGEDQKGGALDSSPGQMMQPGGFLQRDGDPGEKVSPSPEKWIPLTNSFHKYLLSAYGIPGTARF